MHDHLDREILDYLRTEKSKNLGFKLLMDRYQHPLYQLIYRMTGNHEDTDDALQNTFIKVYSNINRFREESKLFSWLYRIASNEAINYLRKKNRSLVTSLDYVDKKQVNADRYVDMEKGELLFQEAISQLPDRQQQVFIMRYYDNLSYQVMADRLELSTGALKASFHHAVKKIEHHLKSHI